MTTRLLSAPPAVAAGETFPELPPRDDMQNPIYLHDPAHQAALRRHFGNTDRTIVLGETPVGWEPGQPSGLLKPDLLIAFNIDRPAIIVRKGFGIDEIGKPPEFVLEVASLHTAQNDYTRKRTGYANYGVPEYWRFDPSGGDMYPTGLEGDRLQGGRRIRGRIVGARYQPITVHRVDADRWWGHSDVLNLDLCWEYGQLRWFDPSAGRYLLTYDEQEEGRLAAEEELRVTEVERQIAETAYQSAEAARRAAESERQAAEAARQAAEAGRQSAEAGRQTAEAQVRELQEELRRLRGET